MKRTLFLFLLSVFCFVVRGQETDSVKVAAIGRAQKNTVLLRWGINTQLAWKQANQHGFRLERYTIIRNKQLVDQPGKTILADRLVPRPLTDWEELVKKDNNAAIIAQAIYGTDFEVSGGDTTGVASIINKSQELDQRFGFSMYAADQSFEGAKMAGWAWVDSTVKLGEKYLYRIIPIVPQNGLKVDSASVFIGLENFEPLPVPQDLAAIFGDKSIMLSWNYKLLKSYYSAYYVEKSSDGKTFSRISDLPITNLNEKDDRESERIYFNDSLANNTTQWQYRIVGISPFGELGPPSEVIKGKGKRLLAFVPNIRTGIVDEKMQVTLQWEFEELGNPLIRGFTLNRSNQSEGPFIPVKENISPASRSTLFDKLDPTNYFTITAVALEGESRTSMPYLVQPVDSIAPVAPQGLIGKVSPTGVIDLSWNNNVEKDLYGYRIYRANRKGDALMAVTDSLYQVTSFRDSVAINTLNTKIYYAVTAFDQRQNQSDFSALLELKRPDIIPPTPPLITGYHLKDAEVQIDWAESSSDDVASHTLLRKDGNNANAVWERVFIINKNIGKQALIDRTAQAGKEYQYALIATDESGLVSLQSSPLKVSIPGNVGDGAKQFSAYIDRQNKFIQLSWNNKVEHIAEYQLFKSEGINPISLWKIVPFSSKSIIDTEVKISSEYNYGIRAINQDGVQGKIIVIKVSY